MFSNFSHPTTTTTTSKNQFNKLPNNFDWLQKNKIELKINNWGQT